MAPLIDAKGRLFGRWNVIDLGVVTVVVVIGYGCFLATQIMSGRLRRDPPATAATVTGLAVHVRAILRELDPARLQQIVVGDSEQDEEGREVARIVQLGRPTPDFVEIGFGNISVEADHPTFWRLPVKMRLVGEARGGAFFFKGHVIGTGSAIVFRTPRYQAMATITTAWPLAGYSVKSE